MIEVRERSNFRARESALHNAGQLTPCCEGAWFDRGELASRRVASVFVERERTTTRAWLARV
jgi:hypothetical protein